MRDGIEFTLRTPDGQVVAKMAMIPCCFCGGPVQIPHGAVDHLLTCPEAPPQVKRVAETTRALTTARDAGQPTEEAARAVGCAVCDDLYERTGPEDIHLIQPDLIEGWIAMNWGHMPGPVVEQILKGALARHERPQVRPC